MAYKALILFGLFALLFVVSEVAAVSETKSDTVKSESEKTVQPDQYGGGGYNNGGGGYNNRGGGYNNGGGGYNNGGGGYNNGGGGYNNGGGGYNGGGRGGGYCRNGCCYRGYRGCSRCCSYAGEAVQTQPGH
ncbi:unnamed protein product [Cochlearia groenlandica]